MKNKKLGIYCSLLAVVLLGQLSFAATALVEWNSADGYWDVAANWSGEVLPDSDDYAMLTNDGICNLNTTVSLARVITGDNVGSYIGSGTFNVLAGANLTTTSEMSVGDHGTTPNTITGIMNQSGGTVSVGTSFYVSNRGANGQYTISGGTLDVTDHIYLEKTASEDATAKFAVVGGDATINCSKFYIQNDSTVEFTVTDSGISTITCDAASFASIASTASLSINMDESAAFNVDDVFTLIDGGANLSGQFGNYADGSTVQIDGIDTFRVNYDADNNNLLTLTALRTVVPLPSTLAILSFGSGILLKRRRK